MFFGLQLFSVRNCQFDMKRLRISEVGKAEVSLTEKEWIKDRYWFAVIHVGSVSGDWPTYFKSEGLSLWYIIIIMLLQASMVQIKLSNVDNVSKLLQNSVTKYFSTNYFTTLPNLYRVQVCLIPKSPVCSALYPPQARYTSLAVYLGTLQSLMCEHKRGNATWRHLIGDHSFLRSFNNNGSCLWTKWLNRHNAGKVRVTFSVMSSAVRQARVNLRFMVT